MAYTPKTTFSYFMKEAWEDTTKYFWHYFLLQFLCFVVLSILLGAFLSVYGMSGTFTDYVMQVQQQGSQAIWWIIIVGLGAFSWFMVSYLHLVVSKQKSVWNSLAYGFPRIISFLVLGILIDFFGLGHGVFFILPGLIMYTYVIFALFVFVDSNYNVFDSLKQSISLASEHIWQMFWYITQVLLIFGILFLIPFVQILAVILFPIFVPVFLFKLYRYLESVYQKRKMPRKPRLLTHVIISIIGFSLAGFLLMTYLTV